MTSKTDTSQAKGKKKTMSQDQALAKIASSLSENGVLLSKLIEATGNGSRTDVAVARLEDKDINDVVLVADIQLVSKRGVISSVSLENTIPGALEPSLLGGAHDALNKVIDASLVSPLLNAFQALAAKIARENKESQDIGDLLGTPDTGVGGNASDFLES